MPSSWQKPGSWVMHRLTRPCCKCSPAVIPCLLLLTTLPPEGTVMKSFCKLLCLLCSSLLGSPMGRTNIAWANASKHYLKISGWVLKMVRWMSNLLALINTVSDLVHGGSPVSPPPPELHRNGALRKRLLHHFLMALHYYMYWRNQQRELALAETAGSNICMSEWPSHLSQMVLLCHSSPQLFYLPGSTWMAQLWCKYQMSLSAVSSICKD